MLLREHGDGVIAIGQASHAWISGQMARAWGNARFPPPERREEVCLAAEQHDIGMAEWDLSPALNRQTGRPLSFLELTVETHIGLWTAAPAKLLSQSRYAALLVSMHGCALNERRNLLGLDPAHRELVAAYLEGQRALQRTLAEQVGAGPGELARNQRLVWTWDSLSLAVCLRWPKLALVDVPATTGLLELALKQTAPDQFTLDPWPFAGERVEVCCEGRLLGQRCETDEELRRALRQAPGVRLAFTLAPAA